jgi:hypothetical protein
MTISPFAAVHPPVLARSPDGIARLEQLGQELSQLGHGRGA